MDISRFIQQAEGMAQQDKRSAILAELRTVDDRVFQIAVRGLASESDNALNGAAWDKAAAGLLFLKEKFEKIQQGVAS